ncbi:hypothetical protein JCM1840_001743, partial [Sporobolomyces johnsonii]
PALASVAVPPAATRPSVDTVFRTLVEAVSDPPRGTMSPHDTLEAFFAVENAPEEQVLELFRVMRTQTVALQLAFEEVILYLGDHVRDPARMPEAKAAMQRALKRAEMAQAELGSAKSHNYKTASQIRAKQRLICARYHLPDFREFPLGRCKGPIMSLKFVTRLEVVADSPTFCNGDMDKWHTLLAALDDRAARKPDATPVTRWDKTDLDADEFIKQTLGPRYGRGQGGAVATGSSPGMTPMPVPKPRSHKAKGKKQQPPAELAVGPVDTDTVARDCQRQADERLMRHQNRRPDVEVEEEMEERAEAGAGKTDEMGAGEKEAGEVDRAGAETCEGAATGSVGTGPSAEGSRRSDSERLFGLGKPGQTGDEGYGRGAPSLGVPVVPGLGPLLPLPATSVGAGAVAGDGVPVGLEANNRILANPVEFSTSTPDSVVEDEVAGKWGGQSQQRIGRRPAPRTSEGRAEGRLLVESGDQPVAPAAPALHRSRTPSSVVDNEPAHKRARTGLAALGDSEPGDSEPGNSKPGDGPAHKRLRIESVAADDEEPGGQRPDDEPDNDKPDDKPDNDKPDDDDDELYGDDDLYGYAPLYADDDLSADTHLYADADGDGDKATPDRSDDDKPDNNNDDDLGNDDDGGDEATPTGLRARNSFSRPGESPTLEHQLAPSTSPAAQPDTTRAGSVGRAASDGGASEATRTPSPVTIGCFRPLPVLGSDLRIPEVGTAGDADRHKRELMAVVRRYAATGDDALDKMELGLKGDACSWLELPTMRAYSGQLPQGRLARDTVHIPVREVLRAEFPDEAQAEMRVLFPCAGLGRLAWEIACDGFSVKAEVTTLYDSVLGILELDPEPCDVHPFLFSRARFGALDDYLAPVQVPDVEGDCSTCEGGQLDVSVIEFGLDEAHGEDEDGTWHACVTILVLTQVPDIPQYVADLAAAGARRQVGPLR